jgi:hypothetical protein
MDVKFLIFQGRNGENFPFNILELFSLISFICYDVKNKLKEMTDRRGLPTFVVSDPGRTQVLFFIQ